MFDLLPPNATAQERAMDGVTARIGDVPTPVRQVWNADTCPADVLPWLAWAFSVDYWPPGMTEQQQRDTIKASLYVHQHKGTIGAVKDALGSLGIGVTVFEWWQDTPPGDPYTFRIETAAMQSPITLADMQKISGVVDRTKNVRSHLAGIRPAVTSQSEVFVGMAASVGAEITVAGGGATLTLDGSWMLDASQMVDGFKHADSHTLDGSWTMNGATVLNGITT